MDALPSEIVRHIFLCLDREDWRSVLCVCKGWYSLGMRVFIEVLLYKGTRLLQLKQYKRSLTFFDEVLIVIDKISRRERDELKLLPDSEKLLRDSAEEFTTKQSRVLNNKAVALMNLRQHEEAITCLEKVLLLKPDHVKAMNNLGDNLNSLQKYDEAIQIFDRALIIDPQRLSVLYNKGNSLLHMKKYHEAIEWYDKAIQVQPRDVDSLGNKAIALYRLGCLREAIKYFDDVLKYNPKDRIALRYKEYVTDELKKREAKAIEEVDLNTLTIERKKEADLQKHAKPIKLGIIGAAKVGKTSIAEKVLRDNMPAAEAIPAGAPQDNFKTTQEVNGEWFHIEVIDVTNIEQLSSETLKEFEGFLLVYSIVDKSSFNEISKIWKKKLKAVTETPTAILVGNKVDLKQDRQVSYKEAYELSTSMDVGFLESSATVPINVKFAATSLLGKVVKSIQDKEKKELELSKLEITKAVKSEIESSMMNLSNLSFGHSGLLHSQVSPSITKREKRRKWSNVRSKAKKSCIIQ